MCVCERVYVGVCRMASTRFIQEVGDSVNGASPHCPPYSPSDLHSFPLSPFSRITHLTRSPTASHSPHHSHLTHLVSRIKRHCKHKLLPDHQTKLITNVVKLISLVNATSPAERREKQYIGCDSVPYTASQRSSKWSAPTCVAMTMGT